MVQCPGTGHAPEIVRSNDGRSLPMAAIAPADAIGLYGRCVHCRQWIQIGPRGLVWHMRSPEYIPAAIRAASDHELVADTRAWIAAEPEPHPEWWQTEESIRLVLAQLRARHLNAAAAELRRALIRAGIPIE